MEVQLGQRSQHRKLSKLSKTYAHVRENLEPNQESFLDRVVVAYDRPCIGLGRVYAFCTLHVCTELSAVYVPFTSLLHRPET